MNLVDAFARISPPLAMINFGGVVIIGQEGFTIVGVAPIANQSGLKDALAPFAAALTSGNIFSKTLIEGDVLVPSYPTYTTFFDFYEQSPTTCGNRHALNISTDSERVDDNLSKLASKLGDGLAAPLFLQILMTTPRFRFRHGQNYEHYTCMAQYIKIS